MNDHVTVSTFQLFERFPDNESARLYLEGRLWPNGVTCPECRSGERITTRKGGYYRCNACDLDLRCGKELEGVMYIVPDGNFVIEDAWFDKPRDCFAIQVVAEPLEKEG